MISICREGRKSWEGDRVWEQFEKVFRAFDKVLMSLTKKRPDPLHIYHPGCHGAAGTGSGTRRFVADGVQRAGGPVLSRTGEHRHTGEGGEPSEKPLPGVDGKDRRVPQISPITRECRSYVQNHAVPGACYDLSRGGERK